MDARYEEGPSVRKAIRDRMGSCAVYIFWFKRKNLSIFKLPKNINSLK